MKTTRVHRTSLVRFLSTGFRNRPHPADLAVLAAGCLWVAGAGEAISAELAGYGRAIMGYQAAVDSTPGTLYFHGSARTINDGDYMTHVDNWSAGADGGQGISFVGVVWPSPRYEQITGATLVLATFGDGGWFGPNNAGPGPGGALTAPTYLTVPTVQVSTNKGLTWFTVPATSDYLTALEGATIGGGMNPNPNPLTATFTFTTALTNINGFRIIGPNGGTADGNGFLGVFELSIQSTFVDSDADGMPDDWERAYGLNPAVNDAAGDLDLDGLSNLQEYLSNTLPNNPDCDGDGYSDGVEVANSSDPNDASSIPGNLARQGTGILGTEDSAGADTAVFNAGTSANINDGDPTSHVDTWNNAGTDPQSFVGILWAEPQTNLLRLELTLATFTDGGWFGPNNKAPAPGGKLNSTYLLAPVVQVSPDGGFTWTNVTATSDYLTTLDGHGIGGGTNPNPSLVTATFILNPPVGNVYGIRLIGSEGGTASRGFLGVSEMKVFARTDSDSDGMDDDWERKHGLIVGVNDAAADPDADGLSNLQEFLRATDPQNPDTDGDGLSDGSEVNIHHTNPVSADTDGDGLSDAVELNIYHTNPLVLDTDSDGYPDGLEVQIGNDPNAAGSFPSNLAFRMDATGILGTEDFLGGSDTPVANAGSTANINDGDLTTRVDTFNGLSPDTLSYVGMVWTNAMTNPVTRLQLSLATFFDGGWFGTNNTGPGSGGVLTTSEDLAEPIVQVSTDGGVTWNNVGFTSDYLVALNNHPLPAVDYGAPTLATATFQLSPPQSNINGIRIIGSEGGTASGGFLGVFELAVLTRVPQSVSLINPRVASGQFRFEFDTLAGASYLVQYKSALTDPVWQTLSSVTGDGTRKVIAESVAAGARFYRVSSQ